MRSRWLLASGLLAELGLLLTHAWVYRFLVDDAFISFRYARNLAEGQGLVFNPGFERVEGYTNFLWVLLLAGFDELRVRPETASLALSLLATVALWALVVAYALSNPPARGREGLILVAPLFLAATRSIAVWSTGGLETRMFEVLVLAGALRLVHETKARVEGRQTRSVAVWLFALATLTRPDGLLLSASAFAAATIHLARRGRLARGFFTGMAPFVALVGGHFVFRLAYYGALLPNTYHAKVGGRVWWSSGLEYFAAFALEYAAYLWIPLLVAGVALHLERKTGFVPALFGSMLVPHALYVASIGGDLFEYRPLDLYLPFLFLLLYDGCRRLARGRRSTVAVVFFLALCLVGIWEIPYRSHRDFPDHYLPSFPGLRPEDPEDVALARSFLAPEKDPVYRLPGLRWVAERHRHLIRSMTASAVGLRQEEHRLFTASVVPEGRRLRALVEQGVLPADTHVALPCVGAIPYYSNLRTLDLLGLTDKQVARSAGRERRIMGHDRIAPPEYVRARGVDIRASVGAHLLCAVTYRRFLAEVRRTVATGRPVYAAEVGDDLYLVGVLPQGVEQASKGMPALDFQRLNDPRFLARIEERLQALSGSPASR